MPLWLAAARCRVRLWDCVFINRSDTLSCMTIRILVNFALKRTIRPLWHGMPLVENMRKTYTGADRMASFGRRRVAVSVTLSAAWALSGSGREKKRTKASLFACTAAALQCVAR